MHTLKLLGELDRTSAVRLEAAIERLCELEVAAITLDLRELASIDTTGVAVIAFRCGWCRRNGRGFAIVRGSPTIQSVFEQAGELARLPFVARVPELPAGSSPANEPATPLPVGAAIAHAHGDSPQRRSVPAVHRQHAVTAAGPTAHRPRPATVDSLLAIRMPARRVQRRRGGR